MELWAELIWAAVGAAALAGVLWRLLGRIMRPGNLSGAQVVLSAAGDGENLEGTLRALIWLRSAGLLRCPIVVADCGLSPLGREAALRLALRWPEVMLWPAANLPEVLDPPIH